jgi:N-acetylglutamate synthase/N-acetylornithine aminotransferase
MNPIPAASPDWDFLVDRGDLRRRVLRDAEPAGRLLDGDVQVRVDAFALTANNLTYAVTGDRFGYWELFPADAGWGRIPAWGVGTPSRAASAPT